MFQVLHTLDTQVVPRNTAQVLLVAPHQLKVTQVLHTLDTQVVPRNTTQVLLVAPHQLKVRHTKLILLFTFIIIVLILLYRSPVSKSCIRHIMKKNSYLSNFFQIEKQPAYLKLYGT